jgi:hypothetical protein
MEGRDSARGGKNLVRSGGGLGRQLAAGGVYVAASGEADGGVDSAFHQGVAEAVDRFAG